MPELAVVKVTRRPEPPPIEIKAEVVEPAEEEVAALTGGTPAAPPADPEALDAAFEEALAPLRTGSFAAAAARLRAFADENPRHPRSDNALYYSGVALLALDDVEGASRAFEKAVDDYPAGDARLDALMKLADCRVRLDQKDGARELYARIASSYPDTPAAAQARSRLRQLQPQDQEK